MITLLGVHSLQVEVPENFSYLVEFLAQFADKIPSDTEMEDR